MRKEQVMLDQLTVSVRRLARSGLPGAAKRLSVPLVRVSAGHNQVLAVAQGDIAMLRGVTDAAADVADCTCPDACERDHANE
jgi:hypothetical protein